MKHSRMLLSFLLLSLIHDVTLATSIQQDSQSQEQREVAKRANSAEEGDKTIPGMEDLPFLGRLIVSIEFRGNRAFTSEKLLGDIKFVKLSKPFNQSTRERLQSDLDRLRVFLYVDNGYLQARFQEPEFENTPTGVKITIPVDEGVLYRAGKIEIVDAKLFSPDEVRETLGLKKGDIIRGYSVVNKGINLLTQKYRERGYIQFNGDFEPEFHAPALDTNEAIADVTFMLDEGEAYTISKISFAGNGAINEDLLRSKLLIKEGTIYNGTLLDKSLSRLNRLGVFEMVKEEDVDVVTGEKAKTVELTFRLTLK